MFPNFFQNMNNSGDVTPLKTTAYYQASAPTALLTPAVKCGSNTTSMDALMLLSAAAAPSSAAAAASLPTAAGNSPCKASSVDIPAAKKQRMEAVFCANSNGSSNHGGNRLDRAVRKLTNRLERQVVEPTQMKSDLSSAISPTSSTSSTASSALKTHMYDSGSYSNCEITSSNESSTQTTPIKRETSPEQPLATATAAAAVSNSAPLLTYMNATPTNFYQAKLASLLQSSVSTGQLHGFLQNLSAFAPTTFSAPNAVAPPLAPSSCFQPATPTGAIDPQNYVQFLKKLATAAALLSTSSTVMTTNTTAVTEARVSSTASVATADSHHSQLSNRCHSEDEESLGSPAGEELGHSAETLLGPSFTTESINIDNNDAESDNTIKVEDDENHVTKLDAIFDNNNNNNGNDDENHDTENHSEGEVEFEESAENLKRSPPPSSNDSVNDNDAEKPFACTHTNCHKRFTNKFLLKKHQFIHTGLRPHACPFCSKRFNRKDNLLRHKKTHLANNGGEDPTIKNGRHIAGGGRRRHNANNNDLLYDVPTEAAMQQLISAFPNGALYSAAAAAFGGLGGAASMMAAAAAGLPTLSPAKRRPRQTAKKSRNSRNESSRCTVDGSRKIAENMEEEDHGIIDPVAIDEY